MKLVIIFSLKKISSRNKIILIVSLFFTLLNSYAQVTNERRIVIRPAVKYKLKPVSAVNFSGYLGNKLDAVINNNVMMEDVEALIEPFRHCTETSLWQTEFWGTSFITLSDQALELWRREKVFCKNILPQ